MMLYPVDSDVVYLSYHAAVCVGIVVRVSVVVIMPLVRSVHGRPAVYTDRSYTAAANYVHACVTELIPPLPHV